jgi:glutamine cyclotransferase
MSPRPLLALLCALCAGCGAAHRAPTSPEPRQLVARIVQRYPHATDAFTQGLVFHQGSLYESTGMVGQGSLRRLSLEQAQPLWMQAIPNVFPEGLASDGQRLFQLTWTEQTLYVWEGSPPVQQRSMAYEGEGWGLCFRQGALVRSDGSATLRLHAPADFRETGRVTVTLRGQPVENLNELECTEDTIYANVWGEPALVQIDPATGSVVAIIDASELVDAVADDVPTAGSVLNGIAIEPGSGRIFLTGKYWPTLFEVVFEPAPTSSAR